MCHKYTRCEIKILIFQNDKPLQMKTALTGSELGLGCSLSKSGTTTLRDQTILSGSLECQKHVNIASSIRLDGAMGHLAVLTRKRLYLDGQTERPTDKQTNIFVFK